MKKIISIVIPIYKIAEEYLNKCLKSIINQNSKEIEIILVDDGSPDLSGEICDKYAKKYSNIKVIHQKNMGVSVARNTGVDAAVGEWIFFIDPDDWIEENTIAKLLELVCNIGNKTDIILFNYVEETKRKNKLFRMNRKSGILDYNELLECQKAPFYKLHHQNKVNDYSLSAVWNKIYKKAFIVDNNIRFLKEAKKGQDRLFNANALNKTTKIYYYNEMFYHYRIYDESITNRYNKNIVELTRIEIKELARLNKEYKLQYDDYLNARVCTRLYSCIRLYYFNKNNHTTWKNKIKELKQDICTEPFKNALLNVNTKLLNFKELIFMICIKTNSFVFLYILVKLYESRKN